VPPPTSPEVVRLLQEIARLRADTLSRIEDVENKVALQNGAILLELQKIQAQNAAIWNRLGVIEGLARRAPALPPMRAQMPTPATAWDPDSTAGIKISQLNEQLRDVRDQLGKAQDEARKEDKAEIDRMRGSQTYWVRYVVGAVAGIVVALLIFTLTHKP
jgi:uncharacterized coiled-coil protein SlyX